MFRYYLRLYFAFLRANMIKKLVYRSNFWLYFLLTSIESLVTFLVIVILFGYVSAIQGWSYNDMMVLTGIFILTHAASWIFFKAGVNNLDNLINRGDLDGYLVKPADPQFLVTVHRLDIEDAGRAVVGIFLVFFGMRGQSDTPLFTAIPLFCFLFFIGQIILYNLMLAIKTISFKSIQGWATNAIPWRLHDLTRFPTDIYRGPIRMVYTVFIPLLFIATVPAKALLGRLTVPLFFGAILAGVITSVIARMIWTRALQRYGSASS